MNAELHCRCRAVQGRVVDAAPGRTNRMVCYCDDCQAFLHQLGRSDLLDAHGATTVVLVAPASLSFQRGAEHIVGLRLSPKGLFRWYTSCCNTPLSNTLRPNVPFVNIFVQAFERADEFGPVIGAVRQEFAIGTPPKLPPFANARMTMSALSRIAAWRLSGKSWPHPFFDRERGEPSYPIKVLSRAERDALRPLCGPTPTATAQA